MAWEIIEGEFGPSSPSSETNGSALEFSPTAAPETLPEGADSVRVMVIAVCATLTPLAVMANLAALVHLCRERERKRRVRSRRLLLQLCLGALLQALIVLPLTLAREALIWWPSFAGDRLCRLLLALQDFLYLLVAFLLVAIALDMYALFQYFFVSPNFLLFILILDKSSFINTQYWCVQVYHSLSTSKQQTTRDSMQRVPMVCMAPGLLLLSTICMYILPSVSSLFHPKFTFVVP